MFCSDTIVEADIHLVFPSKDSSVSLIRGVIEADILPLEGDGHKDILNRLYPVFDEVHSEEK